MRIFVSYAHEDRRLAADVGVRLDAEGHQTFFDRDDLPPGEAFDRRIREEIRSADLFVFLMSPRSIAEGSYALTELEFARKRWPNPAGRVLPVMAAPVADDDIPTYLKSVTYLVRKGDLVAETIARVAEIAADAEIATRRRKRRLLLAGAGAGLLAAVAGVGVGVAIWRPHGLGDACLLQAAVRPGPGHPAPATHGLTLRVHGNGITRTSIVNPDGRALFQVGADQLPGWRVELVGLGGGVLAQSEFRGCPKGPREIAVDADSTLIVRPR